MKTHYVMGFAFTEDLRDVVLIEKQKPFWLAGYWNGPGGKMEPGETPYEAMVREYKEETGVILDTWEHLCTIEGESFVLHVFRAIDDACRGAMSMESERVELIPVANVINLPTKANVRWMLPMAQWEQPGRGMPFIIREKAFLMPEEALSMCCK